MKIIILGHSGLLGNMVYKYFLNKGYEIITTKLRWDDEFFKEFIIKEKPDFIINCIGIIPQRKPSIDLYNKINFELPLWLDTIGVKVIHPDTDESGETPYGLSKQMARENVHKNTKILKTSIIGLEEGTNFSLLEWFLNSKDKVNGFTNQYWNGITTLEWSKYAEKMIINWDNFKKVNILANPECLSKYEILIKIREIFEKNIEIIPIKSNIEKNNCLSADIITKNIFDQIVEMKLFYKNI